MIDPKAMNTLGIEYAKQQNYIKALECFENAHFMDKNNPDICNNYAKELARINNFEKANSLIEDAIKLKPNSLAILINFINIKYNIDDINSASFTLMYVIDLLEDVSILHQIAEVLDLNLLSLVAYSQANIANWQGLTKTRKLAKFIVNSNKTNLYPTPMSSQILFTDIVDIANANTIWNKSFATKKSSIINYKHDKIKIGYISADFSDHPVGFLFNNLPKYHNSSEFEIYGFPTVKHKQQEYHDICKTFDNIHELYNTSHDKAAKIIKNLEIDILIDLTGPTMDHCFNVLALRPATVQACILGFTGPINADFIDYTITTKIETPENLAQYYKCTYLIL